MQYKILDSTRLNTDAGDPDNPIGPTSLQTLVREHIEKGWRPLGGVGSWGGEAQTPEFYQAMVKD